MQNLLTDPLIRVRTVDGSVSTLSLPEVYEAMVSDKVSAFQALRPHQRHSWHAFLAQLGVLALGTEQRQLPRREGEWRLLLRGLTPDFPDGEPWKLVVNDPSRPAFMQCPSPDGLGDYKGSRATPDDLDLLVTSKNHDLKAAIAVEGQADDWIFALVNLQTMGGFLGAGNYGIARMNGGFSSRPCLGLAPANGGVGAHLVHDIQQLIDNRQGLLQQYEQYFSPVGGVGLVWIEPWDGTGSLGLTDLDPYFIEICRRVRLKRQGAATIALTATSKKRRIAAAQAKGDLGDHWTPVDVGEGKALSISRVGFRYDRLAKLVLDQRAYRHPNAMTASGSEGSSWRLVARGVAAGQGKTEGYHERADIIFNPRVSRSLFGGGQGSEVLEDLATAQIEEVGEVARALRFGIAVAASGGKDADSLGPPDWEKARPYLRRLDWVADARFFEALQERFGVSEEERATARRVFSRRLIRHGRSLLLEAIKTVPCPAIQRYRAEARAKSAFWWRLRRPDSVFSDQPDIFETRKQEH
ncbi:type I-E CRISPR-associated protein Cse1/CasA [Candidatus Palauibacter sp.]|uniref:type I-E CRISPR-associated protein Cse1/CasA n=1 Tax=Candidatus Palauibacter sp. TaxID=3101350 RepID=UPI003B59D87B